MREFLNVDAVAAPRRFSHSMRTVTLLCLLGILAATPVAAVDRNCNYQQHLEPGTTYYVFNPNYPNQTKGQRSCRWVATTESERIRLTCTEMNLPCSKNCANDAISVSIGKNVTHRHCGNDWFIEESFDKQMVIDFVLSRSSNSKFLCQLRAISASDENCQCGWKKPTRIVGGVETGINEYPMMAGLVDSQRRELYCGATIISHEYVLTAAHCVINYDLRNLGVVVGEHDVETGSETNATKLYRVREIVTHPDYAPHDSTNDIALVRIDGTIRYSMEVGPACLPFQHAADSFSGSVCTALGWGLEEFGGPKATKLQKVNLHVIPNMSCRNAFHNVNNNEMCTFSQGKDPCQFDSGGPLMKKNEYTTREIVIGIVSQGRGCAGDDPALNVRVGAHIGWILNTAQNAQFCMVE